MSIMNHNVNGVSEMNQLKQRVSSKVTKHLLVKIVNNYMHSSWILVFQTIVISDLIVLMPCFFYIQD